MHELHDVSGGAVRPMFGFVGAARLRAQVVAAALSRHQFFERSGQGSSIVEGDDHYVDAVLEDLGNEPDRCGNDRFTKRHRLEE